MGAKQYTSEKLLTLGVEWVKEFERWPTTTQGPINDKTASRYYGSWRTYKEALMGAYIAQYGPPDWDYKAPRLGTARAQLQASTLAIFEEALARVNTLKPHRPRLPKRQSKKDSSELMLVISDVHVGEYNDPKLMSGLTGPDGYNFKVFCRYADILEERVFFFRDLYGKAWDINKLVVNVLGDLVTGEQIFLGQALQMDRILADQVFEAAHRFASMIRNWAQRFPEVEVYCIPGNHGRLGKKGELHWRSNMDYMAYRVMATLLADCENVRFIIAEGPFLIVEHGEDWRFLLHHGDCIPGAGVAKGNLVTLERKVHQFSQMANTPIHYSITGHQHRGATISMAGGGKLFANGSWPGGSPFSVSVLGDVQVALQKLLLFHHKRGVHSETDIQLASRITLTPDDNRVLTENYRTTG